eukprot:1150887-Pelagomonas_calceolata.AAC.1
MINTTIHVVTEQTPFRGGRSVGMLLCVDCPCAGNLVIWRSLAFASYCNGNQRLVRYGLGKHGSGACHHFVRERSSMRA